jgi:hypothetical protein
MPAGLYDSRFLNSANLQKIIEVAASRLERERPLTYIDRLSSVNATDDEITGRFVTKLLAADVLAPDGKAMVYEAGQITLFVDQLAKLKFGRNFSENQLQQLDRLRHGLARRVESDAWFEFEMNFGANLLHGLRMRQNQLACAMMTDSLTINRLGLQLSALTWGMPNLLKVTVSPAWSTDGGTTSNVAAAFPVRDILTLDRVDADNYGLGPFDRVTMSSQALDIMTQTDDFRNRVSLYTGLAFPMAAGMLPKENRGAMIKLLSAALEGKEIVIDDAQIREQAADGTTATTRYLPANKVLVDRQSNGAQEWDWGNAILMESLVAELSAGGTVIGENLRMLAEGSYGPLAYYTAADAQLNPPGVNAWICSRGFPRKFIPEASAVLTVW